MKTKFLLYYSLFKVTFLKAKDTKYIVILSALVVAVISILFSVSENIEKSFAEAVSNSAKYDVMVTNLSEYDTLKGLEEQFESDNVEYISGVTEAATFYLNDYTISAIGAEGDFKEIYQIRLVEGQFPHNEDEIVFDQKYNENTDKPYNLGDEISLSVYSMKKKEYETVSYKICGFFETEHTSGNELYSFCTIEGMQRALEIAEEDTAYVLLLKAQKDSMEAVISLIDKVRITIPEEAVPIGNERRINVMFDMENGKNSFVNLFKGLGVFIALASVFLIFNMMQISSGKITQTIGILRSIGLNSKQLLVALCVNLISYIVCVCSLGVVIAIIFERVFGATLFHNFMDSFVVSEYVEMGVYFNFSAFMEATIIVVFIIALAYVRIILQILKMNMIDALKFSGCKQGKINIRGKQKAENKTVTFIGRRNLMRNKGRTLYTAGTIFIMSLLLLTITVVVLNVNLFDMDALKKANSYDLEFYKEQETDINNNMLDWIANMEEVSKVDWCRRVVYEFFVTDNVEATAENLVETRIYSESIFDRICKENNLEIEHTETPVYLVFGNNMAYKKGDIITLYDVEKRQIEIPVWGVITKDNYCDYYMENNLCIVMNESGGKCLLGDNFNKNILLIKTNNKELCIEQVKHVLTQNNVSMIYNDLSNTQYNALSQLRSILSMCAYIVLCIGIMSLVNIVCNIDINIQLRKNEYGILSALGMKRKELLRLLTYEIMSITEMALIISMPVSIVLALFFLSGIGESINVIKLLLAEIIGAFMIMGINGCVSYMRGYSFLRKDIMNLLDRE